MPEKTTFFGAAKRYNMTLRKYGYSPAVADRLTSIKIDSSKPLKVPRNIAYYMRMYKEVWLRAGYSEKYAKSMTLSVFRILFY